MDESNRYLWPFSNRASLFAAVTLLFSLLLLFAAFRVLIRWPSEGSEVSVLVGVLLVSSVPIALALIDVMMQRGGIIEVRGVKLDFTHMQTAGVSGATVPVNIGMRGEPVSDSDTTEVMRALRQAIANDIVIVDLEEGQAWWETRLLVLLAGAERLKKPELIVFVGTEGGKSQCFQGWGYPEDLLHVLKQADPQYRRSLQRSHAVKQQYDLLEPDPIQDSQSPTSIPPGALSGSLANRYSWMIFDDDGNIRDLLGERVLANELGENIESQGEARLVTLTRLEELFRPMLNRESIDKSWSNERQIESLLESEGKYLALTQKRTYVEIVSRMDVLNELIRSIIK